MITHTLFCFNVLVRFDVKIWSLKMYSFCFTNMKSTTGQQLQSIHVWADST